MYLGNYTRNRIICVMQKIVIEISYFSTQPDLILTHMICSSCRAIYIAQIRYKVFDVCVFYKIQILLVYFCKYFTQNDFSTSLFPLHWTHVLDLEYAYIF